MWDPQLHRPRGAGQEGAQLRGGRLVHRLHHVSSAASVWPCCGLGGPQGPALVASLGSGASGSFGGAASGVPRPASTQPRGVLCLRADPPHSLAVPRRSPKVPTHLLPRTFPRGYQISASPLGGRSQAQGTSLSAAACPVPRALPLPGRSQGVHRTGPLLHLESLLLVQNQLPCVCEHAGTLCWWGNRLLKRLV